MGAPSPAINQQIAWKNPEMRRFAVALVKAALKTSDEDFTTDIVGNEFRSPDAPGLPGSVTTILKDAHIIEPVGIMNNGAFYPTRRQSERPEAKSRYLNAYRLASVPVAREFLKRNNSEPWNFGEVQSEMFAQPTNLAAIAS